MTLRRQRAFTLIEVVLAISILILLAGASYAIVKSTMESVSYLNQYRIRQQELDGSRIFIRNTLLRLPVNSSMQSKVLDPDATYPTVVLDMTEAATLLDLGPAIPTDVVVRLAATPEPGGRYRLELSTLSRDAWNNPGTMTDEDKTLPPPLTLLSGLNRVAWRFYDSRSALWQDQWTDTSNRPALVELSLYPSEADRPIVSTFWLPPLVASRALVPPAVPSTPQP